MSPSCVWKHEASSSWQLRGRHKVLSEFHDNKQEPSVMLSLYLWRGRAGCIYRVQWNIWQMSVNDTLLLSVQIVFDCNSVLKAPERVSYLIRTVLNVKWLFNENTRRHPLLAYSTSNKKYVHGPNYFKVVVSPKRIRSSSALPDSVQFTFRLFSKHCTHMYYTASCLYIHFPTLRLRNPCACIPLGTLCVSNVFIH